MNKYRKLGYAILLYAFVTSGASLSLISGWPEAVNGVLWLVYVLGGFGLIRGRNWGRVLTLIATSGSLIAMFALLIFTDGAELAYMSTVWPLLGIPAIFLFVWALLVGLPGLFKEDEVPLPSEHTGTPRISRRRLHDIAYISYIILGLISLWTASLEPEPNVIGMGVLIPFGIPLLLALILGPGISLYLWRDYRLVGLTILTIVIGIVLGNFMEATWYAYLLCIYLKISETCPINAVEETLFAASLCFYGAIAIAIGVIWFTKYRKHFL
jgi:hypothetical protein